MVNTRFTGARSPSLQDRWSLPEAKTREPAKDARSRVSSPLDSPPKDLRDRKGEGKGEGLFEKELTQVTQKDFEKPKAKTEKTENLRSHSGAGTEGRKSEISKKSGRETGYETLPETARKPSSIADDSASVHEDASSPESEDLPDGPNVEVKSASSMGARVRARRVGHDADEVTSNHSPSEDPAVEKDEDLEEVDADSSVAAHFAGHVDQAHASKSKFQNDDPVVLKQAASGRVDGSVLKSAPANEFTPKQKAMLELLQGMQSELGIPPETMLKAFGDMSEASLEAPPEATLKEFIGKLTEEAKLSPQQSLKATSLYGKFLGEHAQADFDETIDGLKMAGATQDGTLANHVLEDLNDRVQDLQMSLKGLQANAQSPGELEAEVSRLMQLSQSLKAGAGSTSTAATGLATDDLDADVSAFGDDDAKADKTFEGTLAGLKTEASAVANDQGSSTQTGGQFGGQPNGQSGGQTGHAPARPAGLKTAANGGRIDSTGAKGSLRGEIEQALKSIQGHQSEAGQTSASSVTAGKSPMVSAAVAASAEGSVLQPAMTPKDEEANVKELMRQAQLIVKKGGGEMKLEMSPEGMGKVHLKVGVENGQVSVQMLAESDAAKKMLEGNLGELRASLMAHKLHVDQLKVDTKVEANADVSKQMDQQMRGDANRDHSRQFARDFMGEFREDREGFRQGMFSDPKTRGYGQHSRAQVKADAVSAMSARRGGTSSRLNVVA